MAMREMDMNMGSDEGMQMGMDMDMQQQQSGMNPIEMIKADHRKVEKLFEQFEGEEDKRQKLQIAQQICMEVTVHALLEEELIYPMLHEKDEETEEEAFTEHELIKFMISEVKGLSARDKALEPKMKVMKELIEHHVEEEESEALPKLEGNQELMQMSDHIMQRKQQLMEKEMGRGKRKTSSRSTTRRKTAARSSSTRRTKSSTSAKKSAAGKKGAASGAKKSTSTKSKSSSSTSKSTKRGSTKRGTTGRNSTARRGR